LGQPLFVRNVDIESKLVLGGQNKMTNIKDVPCPNCGRSVVRFIYFDKPRRANYIIGVETVGMAVHREIMGYSGSPIPEVFCYLDEDDWNKHISDLQDEETQPNTVQVEVQGYEKNS